MKRRISHKRIGVVAAAILVPLAAAGCFNPFSPVILNERVTSTAPSPTTPQNTVKLFEWCWVNRGIEEYKELFTADYEFISAGLDSAGNPSREVQARRDDEIQTAENMFIGSPEREPAAKITLNFDRNFVPFPDPRPGYVDSLFKAIRTSVDLTVDVGDGTTLEVRGYALFYLVRGDTAAIPTELQGRFGKDKGRWWICRWEDETLSSETLIANGVRRARPAGSTGSAVSMTMGELKRYWMPQAIAAALRAANDGGARAARSTTTHARGARAAP